MMRRLDDCNIRVAAYMTELPSKRLLEQKLRDAVDLLGADWGKGS
jgi:hypothetical protein